tara:strand:+ start:668 stop:934 length:267 start_codon:yes stop_codon:yes gene_type:complete
MVKLKDLLSEKCQKGYKTHPTRKTKKMFGKTYRNCVKAEAEEKVTEGKADKSFTKMISILRKEFRKLNDDDSYELGIKLKQWFNKNVL